MAFGRTTSNLSSNKSIDKFPKMLHINFVQHFFWYWGHSQKFSIRGCKISPSNSSEILTFSIYQKNKKTSINLRSSMKNMQKHTISYLWLIFINQSASCIGIILTLRNVSNLSIIGNLPLWKDLISNRINVKTLNFELVC